MSIDNTIIVDAEDLDRKVERILLDCAPVLHEVFPEPDVRFVWHAEPDHTGHDKLRLTISDSQLGQAEHRYYPMELASPYHDTLRHYLRFDLKPTLHAVGFYRQNVKQFIDYTGTWAKQNFPGCEISHGSLTLNEFGTGIYVAPTLTIRLNEKYVKLNPTGFRTMGAQGAIEVVDDEGESSIELHSNSGKSKWHRFIESDDGNYELPELIEFDGNSVVIDLGWNDFLRSLLA